MEIRDALNNFGNIKVLVLGDIMLDQYIKGNVSRVSPEAPVQVVNYKKTENILGGAGNVVHNLIKLGARVGVFGIVGDDENKKYIIDELEKLNVDYSGIVVDVTRPTIVKQRIVAGNEHQLLRIDYEDDNKISEEVENKLIEKIPIYVENVDIVVIADYDKGIITKNIVSKVIEVARQNNKKVLVDCKPNNLEMFYGVDLIKPNEKEALAMAQVKDLNEAGRIIKDRLNCNILITRGKDGVSVFEKDKEQVDIGTNVRDVFDVTGAGDTFMATVALGLASGLNYVEAAKLANIAGGIVVQKHGTSFLSLDELRKKLEDKNG